MRRDLDHAVDGVLHRDELTLTAVSVDAVDHAVDGVEVADADAAGVVELEEDVVVLGEQPPSGICELELADRDEVVGRVETRDLVHVACRLKLEGGLRVFGRLNEDHVPRVDPVRVRDLRVERPEQRPRERIAEVLRGEHEERVPVVGHVHGAALSEETLGEHLELRLCGGDVRRGDAGERESRGDDGVLDVHACVPGFTEAL